MASGVNVADGVQQAYAKIKTGMKYRFLIFYIKDDKEIDVEKFGEREAQYDDFLNYLASLGPDKCRYGLYDFEYEHTFQGTSNTKMNKLVLMSWCPDTAKIKTKMLYSTSFNYLKQALEGIGKCIQATDMSEASYESVLEKCSASDRS
ncbi:cofilin/actin-depolymerizing factor homolog [Homarus americanus]|uniref:Cofilin/actin-depolymerizing factor-like 2 n=1 Tax=Homarus americanus TaxID=6706 RepID=A0A8J5JAZ5_HOMAM|nr:cofilin/actin-depolymerizing factor homolog [Homarus americanus]XP_042208486.1 cofilin/actin-depolymerizing factor homolog [Homarus americanus]KAG7154019.1 Cofilin/actin-depolymerizing factor-like 2 [Homarus americanus]